MVAASIPVPTHLAASDVAVTTDIGYWMMDYSVKVSKYVLNMSFQLTLTALSCDPVLEAPLNGVMECDRQTVGGTCRFTCDEGYTLRGSDSRTCLPSLQWREPPAICDPPMCPHLTPPDNGFVLFPCTREEGHLCHVVCAHGYSLVGPSSQTCRKDNMGSLVWSDGPQCVGESTLQFLTSNGWVVACFSLSLSTVVLSI